MVGCVVLPGLSEGEFVANRQVFLVGCRRDEFAFLEDVLEVEAGVLPSGVEKRCHHRLRQPCGLAFKTDAQFEAAIFALVVAQLGFGGRFVHSAGMTFTPRSPNSGAVASRCLSLEWISVKPFSTAVARWRASAARR